LLLLLLHDRVWSPVQYLHDPVMKRMRILLSAYTQCRIILSYFMTNENRPLWLVETGSRGAKHKCMYIRRVCCLPWDIIMF